MNEGVRASKHESERERGRVSGEERGKSFMWHGKRGEKKRGGELIPAAGLNSPTPCPL